MTPHLGATPRTRHPLSTLPLTVLLSAAFLFGSGRTAFAADEIHWTILGPDAVAFDWRGPETEIEYGLEPGGYDRAASAHTPDPLPDSSPGPFREARLTDLEEDTIYYYRIGTVESSFRTPPAPGTSGFWVSAIADVGSSLGYRGVAPTQAQIAADNPEVPGDDRPRFVLVHGDLTYGDEHGPAHVDQHFNDVMPWSRWAAYMPAWGNHEWGSSLDDLQNYEGRFALPNSQTSPNAPSTGGPGEDWYWFDYGNVRFVVWPEPYSGAWRDWGVKAADIMEEAQEDDDITFIVAVGHRPPYSSGRDHGSNSSLAAIMGDLRERYPKFVLSIAGHSHHYERTDPAETEGIVHIVNGIGGSTVGGLLSEQPTWSEVRRNHLGHVRLRFRPDRIEGYAICGPPVSGATDPCPPDEIFDQWTIVAAGVDPGDTTEVEPIPQAAAEQVHWTITGPRSVTFDWAGEPSVIRWGLTAQYTDSMVATTPSPVPVSSDLSFWEARITGLDPDTTYHYQIGEGADHTFRTPPERGESGFTIAAQGDVGSSRLFPAMPLVQQLVADVDPRFVLVLGDLTFGDGRGGAAVEAHFNDVMIWSQDAAYMPAWGDHDVEVTEQDDPRNYEGRFDLPNPRTAVGAPEIAPGEDWHWFDYGNGRFIAYPESFVSGDTWDAWAAAAESLMSAVDGDPEIDFVITFGHRPAWSSGDRDGSTTLQGLLAGLGERHPKYVLNLSSHSRHYERSHPQSGVVHVVVGGGGAPLQAEDDPDCPWLGGCPAPEYSAFRALRHGALTLRFSDDAIVGEMSCGPTDPVNDVACSFGEPLDQFRIERRGGVEDGLGPELVGNPSFETDLEGWSNYMDAELEHVSGGRTDDRAVRVSRDRAGLFGLGDHPNWVDETTEAGVRYRVAAWVRGAGFPGTIRLKVREYHDGDHLGSATSEPVTPGEDWTRIEVEYVAGRSGSSLDFQLLAQADSDAASFEVDDVSIRVVLEPSPDAAKRPATVTAAMAPPGDGSIAPRIAPNPGPVGAVALTITTAATGPLRVELFDVSGRRVRLVRDEVELAPGTHVVPLASGTGGRIAAGVYFCVVHSARGRETTRVTISN